MENSHRNHNHLWKSILLLVYSCLSLFEINGSNGQISINSICRDIILSANENKLLVVNIEISAKKQSASE